MKEEILKVIENANRSLNSMEILNIIKDNNTVEDLRKLMGELDEMCTEGVIRLTSGNGYVKNEMITGIIDMHEKGNAHVIVPGHEDIFISRKNIKDAADKDTVLVEMIDKTRNEGRVFKIIDRALETGIGEVINDNGSLKVISISKNLPYQVNIMESDLDLLEGHLVKLKYVRNIDKGRVLAKVDHIISHKNAPDVDTKMIAEEFGIPYEFSKETLEEAKKMPKELTEEMINSELLKGRENFRNEIIFTIDGKDTKDIDDAISLKMLPNGNYELGVHIADVSHYVKEGNALWKEAELRGNSNYLGDKVVPMLPIELSNGICSLNENTDRFTTSCIMEIDHSGKVVNKRLTKGIINSRKKMNYDAVQDILENKDTEDTKGYTTLKYILKDNETLKDVAFNNNMTEEELLKYNSPSTKEVNVPVKTVLHNMFSLSKILRSAKHRRGELEFVSDEIKFGYDENGKVNDIHPRVQRESEKLIEDFMIVANESVASMFFEMDLPFVYRLHDVPSPKSIADFLKFLTLLGEQYPKEITIDNVSNYQLQQLLEYYKNKPTYKIINKKLLRSMQKAYYGTDNIGHYGIASTCYTHFTSPIRRFSDLLVHTCITEYLINKNIDSKFLKDWKAYLTYICEHISETERTSEKAEYAMGDMLIAEYMEGYTDENGNHIGGHIGEEYDAVIDTCLPHSFFVQTNNYVEGRVDLNTLKDFYQYKEELMGYTKNNKLCLRYGDKVRVKCINASKSRREVDFTLVRKL